MTTGASAGPNGRGASKRARAVARRRQRIGAPDRGSPPWGSPPISGFPIARDAESNGGRQLPASRRASEWRVSSLAPRRESPASTSSGRLDTSDYPSFADLPLPPVPAPPPAPPPPAREATLAGPATQRPASSSASPPVFGGVAAGPMAAGLVGSVGASGPPPASTAPPPPAPSARFRGRRDAQERQEARRQRRNRSLVVSAMAGLVCLGAALTMVGLGQVRSSTAGRYIDPSLGPDQPGYAAFVTPTPTLLMVHKGADGQLASAAVLALQPQDQGGSVILLPAATRAFFGQTPVTLAQGYVQQGRDGVSSLVEQVLKVDLHETVEVDDAVWARLVEPVGSVPVDLDTPVGNWPAGAVSLTPAEVGPFLAARTAGQNELTRTDRQEMFWRAWLSRVTEVGATAIAGEGSSGLGRFVSGIAAAPDVSNLPVGEVAGAPEEQFEVNESLVGEEIARSIPYPQSPAPGVRLRVRLLNGTHDPGLTAVAAERLVQAGAEITISGNAGSFDETTTRILYADEANIEQAQLYAVILGIGVVEADPASEDVAPIDEAERIDLTVVLGADAPQAFRR